MEKLVLNSAAESVRGNQGESLLDEYKLIDVPTAARWLHVSEQWVYRHWRKLGGKKLGAHIRFIEKEIVERVKGLN